MTENHSTLMVFDIIYDQEGEESKKSFQWLMGQVNTTFLGNKRSPDISEQIQTIWPNAASAHDCLIKVKP